MVNSSGPVAMDDHDRKVVLEFCHLQEKSKQLFNGLRDLPQYGHKQWQTYFGKTFDLYTKLWKYQQQHRVILDTKYGLKRWQIGEIASKIGQLYYHYYLRTSDTNHLFEAYAFYSAIRGRAYYTRASKEDRSELMVKKLRYYARYIVVCLLLKKMELLQELVNELDRYVSDYGCAYEPDDQVEWNVVLEEIKSFLKAEALVSVIHADGNPLIPSHRINPQTTPFIDKPLSMCMFLHEILIVGSCSDQVKFSELTMDMFRMLQSLEREPAEEFCHLYDVSPASDRIPGYPGIPNPRGHPLDIDDRNPENKNPHKYLLYKPTLSQILVFLSSGFKELPSNGILMLYLSADGCFSTMKHPDDLGYDLGGVLTSSQRYSGFDQHGSSDRERERRGGKGASGERGARDPNCLHPGDLHPFTRRPFFLVVDSDNSFVFQHIPRHFGQPLVMLMSPQDLPASFHDNKHYGSLFTHFLHCPLSAFCYCCDLEDIPVHLWERCQSYVDRFVTETTKLFFRSRPDPSFMPFFGDDFLRALIVRYVFCDVVLRMHRAFRGRQHRPRCSPPLPEAELLDHPVLSNLVLDLAAQLEVSTHFHEVNEPGNRSPRLIRFMAAPPADVGVAAPLTHHESTSRSHGFSSHGSTGNDSKADNGAAIPKTSGSKTNSTSKIPTAPKIPAGTKASSGAKKPAGSKSPVGKPSGSKSPAPKNAGPAAKPPGKTPALKSHASKGRDAEKQPSK